MASRAAQVDGTAKAAQEKAAADAKAADDASKEKARKTLAEAEAKDNEAKVKAAKAAEDADKKAKEETAKRADELKKARSRLQGFRYVRNDYMRAHLHLLEHQIRCAYSSVVCMYAGHAHVCWPCACMDRVPLYRSDAFISCG